MKNRNRKPYVPKPWIAQWACPACGRQVLAAMRPEETKAEAASKCAGAHIAEGCEAYPKRPAAAKIAKKRPEILTSAIGTLPTPRNEPLDGKAEAGEASGKISKRL